MAKTPDEKRIANDIVDQGTAHPQAPQRGTARSEAGFFEIHVKGQLDGRWSEWLGGLRLELLENGEMILSGAIVDQAALLGILNKLNRLNLAILSVSEVNQRK